MRSAGVTRDNETWLMDLRSQGLNQEKALTDLRNSLLRGLRGALLARTVGDDAFVEDIVQDALLRILERLSQFEGRSQFLTWATSITVRIAMSELRRRRWKDLSLEQVIADANFSGRIFMDDQPEPNSQLDRKAILDTLYGLIHNHLTEKQRTALLAELKGMPLDEIARRLGSNRSALYKLTHDGHMKLKKGLELAGYEAGDIVTSFED